MSLHTHAIVFSSYLQLLWLSLISSSFSLLPLLRKESSIIKKVCLHLEQRINIVIVFNALCHYLHMIFILQHCHHKLDTIIHTLKHSLAINDHLKHAKKIY